MVSIPCYVPMMIDEEKHLNVITMVIIQFYCGKQIVLGSMSISGRLGRGVFQRICCSLKHLY